MKKTRLNYYHHWWRPLREPLTSNLCWDEPPDDLQMGFWFVLIPTLSHLKINTSKRAAEVDQRRTWRLTWHVLAWLLWPPSLLVTLQATYPVTSRRCARNHGDRCVIISVVCYIYTRYVVCGSHVSRRESALQNYTKFTKYFTKVEHLKLSFNSLKYLGFLQISHWIHLSRDTAHWSITRNTKF